MIKVGVVGGTGYSGLECLSHRGELSLGGDTAVVLAIEDNLVNCATGQAVNMNIVFGLFDTTGLASLPVLP